MKRTHSNRSVLVASLTVMGVLASAEGRGQSVSPAVAPPAAITAPDHAAPDRPAPAVSDPVSVSDAPAEGTLVRRGHSETVINVPMDAVVRAATDYPRYNEFMPHVTESRVVHRNRSATDVYMQVPLGGSLGVIWALLRIDAHRQADRFELTGQSVDSNMDRFETRFLIERMPGAEPRTHVTFEVLALPRLPFPSSVFSREMRDVAHTVATNLRARIERQTAINALAPAAAPSTPAQVPPNATSSR